MSSYKISEECKKNKNQLNKNEERNHNGQKWIIDTDPGVDDSFAIILGMTYLKENILAISIANGNCGIEGCFQNAKKICAIKETYLPIYKGVFLNLSGLKFEASDFHGKDGLLELPEFNGFENKYKEEEILKSMKNEKNSLIDNFSPLKIIELSYKYPGKLNILAIAPLTNIAVALMFDPSLPKRINKIVIMGGSYSSLGNCKSNTEFNFASDPIAARKVFNSFILPNNEIILYPWETCIEYLISKDHINLIRKYDSETKNYIEKILIKKELYPETGIFADYGSAVYMINKNSVKKSKKKYVDISIDSDDSNFGQCIIENDYAVKNHYNKYIDDDGFNCNAPKKKVEIIFELDKGIYYDYFVAMNEN